MGDDDGQARRRKGKTKGKGEMLDDVVMAQKKNGGCRQKYKIWRRVPPAD